MGNIKLEGYVCERCGHKWVPRETTTEEPKVCPKCKSPYWNVPKKNRKGGVNKTINQPCAKIGKTLKL